MTSVLIPIWSKIFALSKSSIIAHNVKLQPNLDDFLAPEFTGVCKKRNRLIVVIKTFALTTLSKVATNLNLE